MRRKWGKEKGKKKKVMNDTGLTVADSFLHRIHLTQVIQQQLRTTRDPNTLVPHGDVEFQKERKRQRIGEPMSNSERKGYPKRTSESKR